MTVADENGSGRVRPAPEPPDEPDEMQHESGQKPPADRPSFVGSAPPPTFVDYPPPSSVGIAEPQRRGWRRWRRRPGRNRN